MKLSDWDHGPQYCFKIGSSYIEPNKTIIFNQEMCYVAAIAITKNTLNQIFAVLYNKHSVHKKSVNLH